MQKTALIADDIDFARRVIREILINAKYTVIAEASNGNEAIALYRQHKPDFVIMDVVMPRCGGIEAARKIIEQDKNAKIIMCSAIVQEQLLFEAVNAGARDFIAKPFAPEYLLKAIEKATENFDEIISVGGPSGASL